MKPSIRFLFIFLFASLFAVTAIEKTSTRFSEVSETDVEIEFTDESENKDDIKSFHISYYHTELHLKLRRSYLLGKQSLPIHRNRSFHFSLNRIYYPQGPPQAC